MFVRGLGSLLLSVQNPVTQRQKLSSPGIQPRLPWTQVAELVSTMADTDLTIPWGIQFLVPLQCPRFKTEHLLVPAVPGESKSEGNHDRWSREKGLGARGTGWESLCWQHPRTESEPQLCHCLCDWASYLPLFELQFHWLNNWYNNTHWIGELGFNEQCMSSKYSSIELLSTFVKGLLEKYKKIWSKDR